MTVAHERRADGRDRYDLTGGDVGRGGRDREIPRPSDVEDADRQAVRVRVLLERDDSSGEYARERGAPFDRLDGEAQHREAPGRVVSRRIDVDVVAQPADRYPHASCSSTIGSFSRKTRMSSMP